MKKIIVTSIIFGIVIIILLCFVIYPLLDGVRKNSQELILAKKELVSFKAETEEFEQSKKVYGSLKADLEKIDELFINSDVPIDLIKFWRETAGDSGLLIDISPTSFGAKETVLWDSIGFRLDLIGSFSNFLKFLEKIETAPYLIEIQNLSAKNLKQSLTIKVYIK